MTNQQSFKPGGAVMPQTARQLISLKHTKRMKGIDDRKKQGTISTAEAITELINEVIRAMDELKNAELPLIDRRTNK